MSTEINYQYFIDGSGEEPTYTCHCWVVSTGSKYEGSETLFHSMKFIDAINFLQLLLQRPGACRDENAKNALIQQLAELKKLDSDTSTIAMKDSYEWEIRSDFYTISKVDIV